MTIQPLHNNPNYYYSNNSYPERPIRVFIPLPRLFPIVSVSSVYLAPSSLLLQYAEDSLSGFTRSCDLDHLESILRTLESRRFLVYGPKALPTLCRYFEALSVYKESLTTHYWNYEEDKLSLTVWSMLSYYTHARDEFSNDYPDLIKTIDRSLVQALAKAVPILRMISECAEVREKLQYLTFKKIELQIRKLYDLKLEKERQATGDMDLLGMSSILNFSECAKLDEIKEKSFLSQREKIEQATQLWETFSSSEPLKEDVLASEELKTLDDKIAELNSELPKKTESVAKMTPKAELTEVKKMIQGLYELEQLEVISSASKSFFKLEPSQEASIQWLILLRESFKVVLSNQSLNTPIAKSLSKFSGLIKTIRDYYEHPEDYVLRLDIGSTIDKKAQVALLEQKLFQDLKKMGAEIKKRIDLRIKNIKKVLQPHLQKTTEDILKALVIRDKKNIDLPQDVRELMAETYPACSDFAARIVHNRDLVSAANEEKGTPSNINGPLYIPFPHQIKPEDIARRLENILTVLKENVTGLSRLELENKLEENLAFRLMVQREISHSCFLLEQFTHKTRNIDFGDQYEKLLESIYQAVRNTRNFQTHDLWRKDSKGTINTAYLLVYDLSHLLSTLQAEFTPFEKDSYANQIFEKAISGTLTESELQNAIEKKFDINCYDCKGRSLLHFLAESPTPINLQLARFAIQKGARVYHADNQQMRPLHYAAQSGFLSLSELLVEAGSVTDAASEGGTPVELAQNYEHPELARYLSLTLGAQRSSNTRALLDAVKNLDLQKVQNLLQKKFDPLADFQGDLPLVTLFDREDENFLMQLEIAQLLVEAGADINEQSPNSGKTALHVAATQSDQPEVISYLMSLRPDLRIQDSEQRTPLHHAVATERENWVNALLAAGSPLNLKDSYEDTPLLIAASRLRRVYSSSEERRVPTNPTSVSVFDAERSADRIMRALLAHGADVEVGNRYGSILYHLLKKDRVEEISALVKRGASPFRLLSRRHRFTPYMLSKNEKAVRFLFEQMQFLFSHLTTEDQISLTFITGRERSPFISWIQARNF